MHPSTFALIFLLFSTQACSQTSNTNKREEIRQQRGLLQRVSLVNLIANPQKYDGKKIHVTGYLHLEFEGNAIYLHEDDCKNFIPENGFWVAFSPQLMSELNPKSFNNKYVTIKGTFNASSKGHRELFGGTIENIVRLSSNAEIINASLPGKSH
ncbi:hypothetical protein SAMN05428949_5890 [Chitinophaga sp. YR627]|uniref:hypothetical protein n=1 Tax=Chitinophaga sp. YR627 TaxID=1881041 RepID=UPI0008E3DF73|nr:hypothetical protein [Chitinophaga sp. YR627]SFO58762.1 hypothetical protein SAMN05428949_5890 [Chitinophaga sp. YR627]